MPYDPWNEQPSNSNPFLPIDYSERLQQMAAKTPSSASRGVSSFKPGEPYRSDHRPISAPSVSTAETASSEKPGTFSPGKDLTPEASSAFPQTSEDPRRHRRSLPEAQPSEYPETPSDLTGSADSPSAEPRRRSRSRTMSEESSHETGNMHQTETSVPRRRRSGTPRPAAAEPISEQTKSPASSETESVVMPPIPEPPSWQGDEARVGMLYSPSMFSRNADGFAPDPEQSPGSFSAGNVVDDFFRTDPDEPFVPVREREPTNPDRDPMTPAQESQLESAQPEPDPEPVLPETDENGKRTSPFRLFLIVTIAALFVFAVVRSYRLVTDLYDNEKASSSVTVSGQRVELPDNGATFAPAAIATVAPSAGVLAKQASDVSAVTGAARTKLTQYPKNPLRDTLVSVKAMKQANPDIVGRLTVGSVLEETVVMRDNTFYLTHDYYAKESNAGAVYVDRACSFLYPPEHLLLWGRSDVSGKVFEPLNRLLWEGEAFAREVMHVSLITPHEDEQYVLYAVVRVASGDLSFRFMSHPTFASDEEMLAFVQEARALSSLSFSTDVVASDRLLTLATVSGGGEGVALFYRMLRDNESFH